MVISVIALNGVKASYEGVAGIRFPALSPGKAAGRRGPAASYKETLPVFEAVVESFQPKR